MFMRQHCYARTPQAHLDLSPCAKRHVPAKRLLRSHAASTLASLSVRKQTCSCDNTAAFARCEHTWTCQRVMFRRKVAAFSRREHTWISLRAQRDMFHRKDCCVPTPPAHLDLSPCASRKTCSCDRLLRFARHNHTWISLRAQRDMFHRKDCCVPTPPAHLDLPPCASRKTCSCDRLLRFARRKHTWISLRAQRDMFRQNDCCVLMTHAASTLLSRCVRKETCSIEKTVAMTRCPPKIANFYLRTPDPVSTVQRAQVPHPIGNP